MADAEIYQKTAQDKAVILNVRGYEIQPFVAPNWVDLRVGFFLSLTSASVDDVPNTTDLSETIVNTGAMPATDRYYLGVLHAAGGGAQDVFIGFTNTNMAFPNTVGNTVLVSSDSGIGAGTTYWRPGMHLSAEFAAAILDSGQLKTFALDTPGVQQHFPRDPVGAGGYAVLLGLQILRDNPQSKTVRVNIKSSAHSADMLYTNTPTLDVLRQALVTWPPSSQMGPVTLSALPDSLYFYWPFRNSRLRIHSYGVVKAK